MELPLPSPPPGAWVAPGTCQGSATPHWRGQWGDNGETVGDGREVSSGDEGEEDAAAGHLAPPGTIRARANPRWMLRAFHLLHICSRRFLLGVLKQMASGNHWRQSRTQAVTHELHVTRTLR